jgi:hypothetical protein
MLHKTSTHCGGGIACSAPAKHMLCVCTHTQHMQNQVQPIICSALWTATLVSQDSDCWGAALPATTHGTASYYTRHCQLLHTALPATKHGTASYYTRHCQLLHTALPATTHGTASYYTRLCSLDELDDWFALRQQHSSTYICHTTDMAEGTLYAEEYPIMSHQQCWAAIPQICL